MAVLAEALGDDGCAQQDENRQEDCHDDGEADEMFDVLEHSSFPGPELGTISDTLRHVIWDTGERRTGR